ncbi:MAG: hypothetical protein MAGBODY4_00613 [Candidatus Marinimicrobia bacterium]|nr:hypothetical protein [Candidatus Neomarinimicrobiota bacterium]
MLPPVRFEVVGMKNVKHNQSEPAYGKADV